MFLTCSLYTITIYYHKTQKRLSEANIHRHLFTFNSYLVINRFQCFSALLPKVCHKKQVSVDSEKLENYY